MMSLSHRSNIVTQAVSQQSVVVYEDHRTLVYVLWHAVHLAKSPIGSPATLVYFDGHDDAKSPSPTARSKAASFRTSSPTAEEVHAFVEWELGVLDDDWLHAAMEMGLIGDAVLFGCSDPANLKGFETTYTDASGQVHRIWNCGHIWEALEYQGCLSDKARRAELQGLWSALGWNPDGYFQPTDETPPVILDFDLDCFTATMAGCRLPWPPDLMINRLSTPSTSLPRASGQTFMRGILERTPFVTIAKESPYCGGTSHSQQILEVLDEILWDGLMFRRP